MIVRAFFCLLLTILSDHGVSKLVRQKQQQQQYKNFRHNLESDVNKKSVRKSLQGKVDKAEARFLCLGFCVAAAIIAGIRVTASVASAAVREYQRRAGEELAAKQVAMMDHGFMVLNKARSLRYDENKKAACDQSKKVEWAKKLFALIMTLTDAYEQLRQSGCYCKLDKHKVCIKDTVRPECPKATLFLEVQEFYRYALAAFQALDLASWQSASVGDIAKNSLTFASSTLASAATVTSLLEDHGKKAELVKAVAEAFKSGFDKLDKIEWDQLTDAVSVVVGISATIYAATADTMANSLAERKAKLDKIQCVKNVASAVSVTSAVVGAFAGEPSSYFFLAGEVLTRTTDAVDAHRERQWWLDTFAPALEKKLSNLREQMGQHWKIGSVTCATRRRQPKKSKEESISHIWYFHITEVQMVAHCHDLDSYLKANEKCQVCKNEMPFCNAKLNVRSVFLGGNTCDCEINNGKAAAILERKRPELPRVGDPVPWYAELNLEQMESACHDRDGYFGALEDCKICAADMPFCDATYHPEGHGFGSTCDCVINKHDAKKVLKTFKQ